MGRTAIAIEPLTMTEVALCREVEAIRGEAKREDLLKMYEIAGCVARHEIVTKEGLRKSLIRVGLRLGKARTTLSRWAFVYRRISRPRLVVLIGMSDDRGEPCTFWDLVRVAKLPPERQRDEIARRLATRSERRKGESEPRLSAIASGTLEQDARQEVETPRESCTRLRSAQPSQGGPGLARAEPAPQRLPTSENARSSVS
jgi:hypothetical protein